jgi:signal transduction histidine kinase
MYKIFFIITLTEFIFSIGFNKNEQEVLKKQYFHYINKIYQNSNNEEKIYKIFDTTYKLGIYLENYHPGILSYYYTAKAKYNNLRGDIKNVFLNYMISLDYQVRKSNDTLGMFYALSDIGNIFFKYKYYNEYTAQFYKSALEITSPENVKHQYAVAFNNIGLIYENQNKLDSALFYFNKGFEIRKKYTSLKDTNFYFAHSKFYISRVLIKLKKYDKAEKLLNDVLNKFLFCIKNYKEYNFIDESLYRLSYAYLLLAEIKLPKREEFEYKAKIYSDKLSKDEYKIEIFKAFANYYLNIHKLNIAVKYYLDIYNIIKKNNTLILEMELINDLANLYKLKHNFTKYSYFNRVYDSLYNIRNETMLYIASNLSHEAYYDKVTINRKLQEIQQIEKQKIYYIIINIAIIFFTIFILSYFYIKNKKKKRIIDNLEKEKKMYFEMLKRRETLASYLAHEVKTPLNVIKNNIVKIDEYLQKLDKSLATYSKNILISIEKLNNFIDEIVVLNKMDDNNIIANYEYFSLIKIIEELCRFFEELAKNKGLNIKYNKDILYGIEILSNKAKVKFILNELIDNAIKFTDKGEVNIGFENVVMKNNQIDFTLIISDSGCGIDKNVLENFKKVDINLPNRGYDNFNIGLSLPLIFYYCYKLGIGIEYKSELNVGTQVFLNFKKVNYREAMIFDYPDEDKKSQDSERIEVINELLLKYGSVILNEEPNILSLIEDALKQKNFNKIKTILKIFENLANNYQELKTIYSIYSEAYYHFEYNKIFSILEIIKNNISKKYGKK